MERPIRFSAFIIEYAPGQVNISPSDFLRMDAVYTKDCAVLPRSLSVAIASGKQQTKFSPALLKIVKIGTGGEDRQFKLLETEHIKISKLFFHIY